MASSPAGDLILGVPRLAEYNAYRAMLFSDDVNDKARAANVLLIACAVDPDAAGMRTLLDDYVALAGAPEVAAAIAKAIGTAKADEEKNSRSSADFPGGQFRCGKRPT